MGFKKQRTRLKRQIPSTIEASEVSEGDAGVATATALSAEESIVFASEDGDSLSSGDATTMTRTISHVLGADDSTKLFTVTSTSTNLDGVPSETAHNADGSTRDADSDSSTTHAGLIAGLVVGLTVIVIALALLVWRRCRRHKDAPVTKLADQDSASSTTRQLPRSQSPPASMPGYGAATTTSAAIPATGLRRQESNNSITPHHEKIYQDDYMSTSYAPMVSRQASQKSAKTNRKSWFSLKSNKTLNQHFDYFRSSRHMDEEDEELRDLPPPDPAVYDRSSPLSELSEKAAMKMFRKPSTTESLRQGPPSRHRQHAQRMTTMTEDSNYSYQDKSRRDSDFEGEEIFGPSSTAHFSYSGDLPKSTSFIDPQPLRY